MLGSRLTGTKDKAALPCQRNWGGGGGAWGSVKGSPFSLLHPLKCIFLHSPPFFARHQNLRVRIRVTRFPSQGLWKALKLRDYRKTMVCSKSYATFLQWFSWKMVFISPVQTKKKVSRREKTNKCFVQKERSRNIWWQKVKKKFFTNPRSPLRPFTCG